MKPSDFQLAREVFDAACDAPEEERAAIIAARTAGNDDVRLLVESLIAEDARGGLELPRDADPGIPEHIGPYRVLRICGRGGMGLVYEAEQDSPRRRVAIKMIRAGAMSDEVLRRFRHESEILGRLQHSGIGQIFEASSIDIGAGPQPYFAMEFIEGLTLSAFARRHDLSLRARLELLARICDAVHYAHQRGVVHRDLKPENIIVQDEDSTADAATREGIVGQPKILDFGIARATDADVHVTTMMTRAGQLVGTLQYMSPEQTSGRAVDVDTRSDIYALGVLLFELVSGKLPYDLSGASIPDALRTIQEQPPTRLSGIDTRYRGDVETIAGKCLEKEPVRRYASASELAEDLRRHLRSEPIAARPPSALYQWRKFVARNRALVGGVVATILALLAGVVIATTYAIRADASARTAQRESYRAALAAASAVLLEDPKAAADYLNATPPRLRGWEWRHLRSRLERHGLTYAEPPEGGPRIDHSAVLRFDERGDRLFAASIGAAQVGVWDARSGEFLRSLAFDTPVTAIDVQGERLAVGTSEGQVVLCDLDGADRSTLVLPAEARSSVVSLRWSPTGGHLAIGTATALCLHGEGRTRTLFDAAATPGGFAFTADGAVLYAIARTRFSDLHAIDVATASDLQGIGIDIVPEDVVSVTLDEAGGRVYVGTIHRLVVALDRTTLAPLHRLSGHQYAVGFVAFHPGERRLASSGDDGTIRVWRDTECVAVLRAEHGTDQLASTAVFTPDGSALAYVDRGRIRLWNPSAGRSTVLGEHDTYVYYLAFSPDGARLASGSYFGPQTFLWDPIRLTQIASLGHATTELGFTSDGRLITSRGVCDATTGERLGELRPTDSWMRLSGNHAWNGERTRRVMGHEPNPLPLTVSDASGATVFEIPGENWGAAFDPTSTLLATCDSKGKVQLWDATDGELLRTLSLRSGTVYSVAFHPDGTRLATGGNDGTIRLWDTSTWEQVYELRGHTSYVKALAFSPDGSQLASGSGDFTVRLWDTISPAQRARQGRGESTAQPTIVPLPR